MWKNNNEHIVLHLPHVTRDLLLVVDDSDNPSSEAALLMPPSTSMHASTSLQIPSVDSNSGPSRHYNQQSPSAQAAAVAASRPVSVAVHPTSPGSANPSASRRQRASHTVVSPTSNSQPHPSNSHSNSHDDTQPHIDVYSHPAAVAYAAAHPRRTIPKFGPYLLLQTLGEGEFGKVKLGLHHQWGEEVAVKLIRRGNVDTTVRMSKVEREIEVLKTLKHPNIVRLYDVIETDKYIGIILEYASGGELFDHILAHRYLRERDAAKLFSQLISGVWYIHQKKIVHRDLKLENLLLDRHRNVIITDFGFANRFEHRSDDLMQTSCGSPCYAAPELVISEGLYVGSAVDIWSCGVILYAMLAGYLPFDDDPANPDGDNINLLYKYIVNTPLSFPDYISAEARDLLGMMLVPDPTRRSSLEGVMRHPWLAAYVASRTDGVPAAFGKSVDDLEQAAMEQHQLKRQAYQKQMRANALTSNALSPASRSQSQTHRPDHGTTAPSSSTRSRSTQPEYLYDSSVDQSMVSPLSGVNTTPTSNGIPRKNYDSPAALGLSDDDPFAAPGTSSINSGPVVITTTTTTSSSGQRISEEGARANASLAPNDPKAQSPSKSHKSNGSGGGGGFRHTIQVEYDEPSSKGGRKSQDKKRERSGSQGQTNNNSTASTHLQNGQYPQTSKERRPSQSSTTKPLPPNPNTPTSNTPSSYRNSPSSATPKSSSIPFSNSLTPTKNGPSNNNALSMENPNISISSPPATPIHAMHAVTASEAPVYKDKETSSQTSVSSMKKGHKKGKSSIDKLGLGKIFSSAGFSNAGQVSSAANGEASSSAQSHTSGKSARVPSDGHSSATSVILSPPGEKDGSSGRQSRRNTLTVMVEPFTRSVRNRAKGRMTSTPLTADGASAANAGSKVKSHVPQQQQQSAVVSSADTALPAPVVGDGAVELGGTDSLAGMQASSNKAKKVMQWFRTKSKGRDSVGFGGGAPEDEDDGDIKEKDGATSGRYKKGYSASSSTVNQTSMSQSGLGLKESGMIPVHVVVTTPTSGVSRSAASPMLGHPQRSASSATDSSATPGWGKRFRNSVTVGGPSNSQAPSSSGKAHPHSQLRVHHGAVDQTTITTRPPPEVMGHVREVLQGMGVEIQLESEYKYRCIRAKKRRGTMGPSMGAAVGGSVGPGSLAAVTMVGSAASNGVDKRGLPLPSPSAFSGTGGMLRGLLMRRQSSQVSATGVGSASQPSLPFDDEGSVVVAEPLIMPEAAYGDPSQDVGDEVRFSVELTRLDRLNDTFSLDIRRLKGNLRSYKFLYDTLRERADLQR